MSWINTATQVELVYNPPYWMVQPESAGAVSGNNRSPTPPIFPSQTLQFAFLAELCPTHALCNGMWSHHGRSGACPGLVVLLAEMLTSPPKLHLSSGTWQGIKTLVVDNT